jgi:transposase
LDAALVPSISQEAFMLYVGLDLSMRRTAVCVVDATGKVMREASVETAPEAIAAAIRPAGGEVERIGLEAGMGSAWLARGLLAAGLPVIVIESAHAAGALRTEFRNKTDRNDARCIADLMRVNKCCAVWMKSLTAQRDRSLLTVR